MTEENDETLEPTETNMNITDLDIDLDIPNYLPLNPSLVRNFDKVTRFQIPLHNTITTSKQDLIKEIEDYVEYIVNSRNFEGSELILETYLSSLGSLIESTIKLEIYKCSIDSCKDIIKESLTGVPDISIDTLQSYRNLRGRNFADSIVDTYELQKHEESRILQDKIQADEDYQLIKKIPFIIKHPQDALPDDVEDDELRVSGGKISLKDPITMNYFETPVISEICHHTFEKSTIESYLNDNTNCPINGCSEMLHKDQLHLDKLMSLRVKIFLASQIESNEDNANVERIL